MSIIYRYILSHLSREIHRYDIEASTLDNNFIETDDVTHIRSQMVTGDITRQ